MGFLLNADVHLDGARGKVCYVSSTGVNMGQTTCRANRNDAGLRAGRDHCICLLVSAGFSPASRFAPTVPFCPV